MKNLLIIFSILLPSSPAIGQERGVLFISQKNGELSYSGDGDDNDPKYVGELKDGKPWIVSIFDKDGEIVKRISYDMEYK